MRLAILAVIVLICAAGNARAAKPGSGMNMGKCEVAWLTVSPSGSPIPQDALPPMADFTAVDTDHDGTIDTNEFLAACRGGLIKIAR
jgi:hypothetical protein